jgi:predicted S18 family serine protease
LTLDLKHKNLVELEAIFTVIVILLSLAVPSAYANALSNINKRVEVSTWILIPAVVEGIPKERGKLINVTITISFPGNGSIYIYNEGGEISNSTKYSMATAVATAALLEGIDWTTFNTNIFIRSKGAISGPSGSLAVALAVYVLLNPLLSTEKLHKYVITGAIAPEGLAGSVGGIKTKCEVAQNANYTFMLPLSNIEDLKNSKCKGYIPVTDVINVVKNIYSLQPLVSNVNLSINYPKGLADAMRTFTLNITKAVKDNIRASLKLLAKINTSVKNADMIRSYLNSAEKLLNNSTKLINKYPYSAASYAYSAYVYSLLAKYLALSYQKGLSNLINDEAPRINTTLSKLALELTKYSLLTLERAELLSVAAARLADAYVALSTTKSLEGSNINRSIILFQLALAKSRALSMLSWLIATEKVRGSTPISQEQLRALALKAYDFAKLNIGYAISLLSSSGLNAEAKALKDLQSRMEYAKNKRDWILLLGYAREALSKATDYVFEYSIASLPFKELKTIGPIYSKNVEIIAKLLSLRLKLYGVRSPLAPAYLEYYEVLKNVGSYDVALKLLWSAVSDLEILSLLFLTSPSYLMSTKSTSMKPLTKVGSSTPFNPGLGYLTGLLAIIGTFIVAFSIGYLIATRNALKEIELRLFQRENF